MAPLGRTGVVLGKAIGGTVVVLLQALVMLVLAPLLGVALSPGLVLTLIPVVIVLSLGLSGLGILIASFMQSQQGFQMLVQILIFRSSSWPACSSLSTTSPAGWRSSPRSTP